MQRKRVTLLAELSKLTSNVDIEKKHSRKTQKYIFVFPGRFSPSGVRNECSISDRVTLRSTFCRAARSAS